MRTNKERVNAVKKRAAQMQSERQQRKHKIVSVCAAAASMILIVNLALWMPGVMDSIACYQGADYMETASIFANSDFLGYIIIGLVAFALGICVTLLCVKLHRLDRSGEKDD